MPKKELPFPTTNRDDINKYTPAEMQNPSFSGNTWEQSLISTVISERDKYERNSMEIRYMLKKAYRNFVGIFDEPYTRYTKRKKDFFALTQNQVLASAANIYVDPRAINILPRGEDDIGKAKIWNALIPFQLKQANFFYLINKFSIDLALFGTFVSMQEWEFEREFIYEEVEKSFWDKAFDSAKKLTGAEVKPKTTKVKVKEDKPSIKQIPLLNCYIDVEAESIQKAPSFIITSWVEASQLDNLKKKYRWQANVEGVEGIRLITETARQDNRMLTQYSQMGITQRELEVPMCEIIYRYAKIPLAWVTKKESDKNIFVEGKITILNTNGGYKATSPKWDWGKIRLLDVSLTQYKHGKRPFEECHYIQVPNRWYGLGVGEMMISPNAQLNRILNQRTDNNELLQNRMFKARRGSGLDNKSIASAPGKVIQVQNMADFEVLDVGDAKASSYTDEQNTLIWAERLTHVKDVSRQKKTATEATIDEEVSGEFFAIVRRNINDYLKRVIQQVIALDQQFIQSDFVVRLVGPSSDFKELDDIMGIPEEIREDIGNIRFITIDDIEQIRGQYDVDVDIDNSLPMNKALMLQGLEKMMQFALTDPESGINRREVYREWANMLNLKDSRFFIKPSQSVVPMPGQMPQQAPMEGVPTNGPGLAMAQGGLPVQ